MLKTSKFQQHQTDTLLFINIIVLRVTFFIIIIIVNNNINIIKNRHINTTSIGFVQYALAQIKWKKINLKQQQLEKLHFFFNSNFTFYVTFCCNNDKF